MTGRVLSPKSCRRQDFVPQGYRPAPQGQDFFFFIEAGVNIFQTMGRMRGLHK